jgi:hypothetical protein
MDSKGKKHYEQIVIKKVKGMRTATTASHFKGRRPRDAALKAATQGAKLILLREIPDQQAEHKVQRVHVFTGDIKMVPVPDNAPIWLKKKALIPKPRVFKEGIIKFKKLADVLPGLPEKVEALLGK